MQKQRKGTVLVHHLHKGTPLFTITPKEAGVISDEEIEKSIEQWYLSFCDEVELVKEGGDSLSYYLVFKREGDNTSASYVTWTFLTNYLVEDNQEDNLNFGNCSKEDIIAKIKMVIEEQGGKMIGAHDLYDSSEFHEVPKFKLGSIPCEFSTLGDETIWCVLDKDPYATELAYETMPKEFLHKIYLKLVEKY